MLQYRQPTVAPENAVPIDQLAAQVAQEVGSVNAEGQPVGEEAALANTSYTLVRSELDRVWKTPAWPAPRATSCIGVGPQREKANMYTFNGLHCSNTVGFIAHGGKGYCGFVG
jgi:hypothetical protein